MMVAISLRLQMVMDFKATVFLSLLSTEWKNIICKKANQKLLTICSVIHIIKFSMNFFRHKKSMPLQVVRLSLVCLFKKIGNLLAQMLEIPEQFWLVKVYFILVS